MSIELSTKRFCSSENVLILPAQLCAQFDPIEFQINLVRAVRIVCRDDGVLLNRERIDRYATSGVNIEAGIK